MHDVGVGRASKIKTTYHHGDLRSALLEAAVALIGERGLVGLSLRECARRAGVSHAAPYRHFADKDALVWAIAEQGFTWLSEAGEAAMADHGDPRDRLDAYGIAYVRFAAEHPVHHRVMFTSQIDEATADPDKGGRAFSMLVEAAQRVVGPEVDAEAAAVAAWSLSHGLSMLILDGRVPRQHVETPDDVETLARTVFSLWRGPLR